MNIVRRLATSQARGDRQLSFINELLSGNPIIYSFYDIPGKPNGRTVHYGISQLSHASWRNLKKRLIQVGFVINENREAQTVQLHFPEMNSNQGKGRHLV